MFKSCSNLIADRTARVWSLSSQEICWKYVGHHGSVNSVRIHPTLRLAVSASGDSTCHVWKIPKDSAIRDSADNPDKLTHQDHQSSLDHNDPSTEQDSQQPSDLSHKAHSSDSHQQHPVQTSGDAIPGSASNVDTSKTAANKSKFGVINKATSEFRHNDVLVAADWLWQDKIASCAWDNSLKVWNLETGRALLDLDVISGAPFSSAQGTISSISGSASLPSAAAAVWATNITTPISVGNASTSSSVTHNMFVSSSSDGYFRIWDIRAEKPMTVSVSAHTDSCNTALMVVGSGVGSADEFTLVSAGSDKAIKIWDRRFLKNNKITVRCNSGANRIAVSSSHGYLAIPLDDGKSKVCDLQGRKLGQLATETKSAHRLSTTASCWSLDESVLVVTSFDRLVSLWCEPQTSSLQIDQLSLVSHADHHEAPEHQSHPAPSSGHEPPSQLLKDSQT